MPRLHANANYLIFLTWANVILSSFKTLLIIIIIPGVNIYFPDAGKILKKKKSAGNDGKPE